MRGDVLHQVTGPSESLVVAGTVRQVGEPGPQVGVCVADEAGVAGVAEQALQDCEGHQLRIGEPGCDTDCWPLRRPLWVFDEEVVDSDVQSGRGRVVRTGVLLWAPS